MERWLELKGWKVGALLSLDVLERFGRRWYEGRDRPGWRRRTPEETSRLFEELGLTGDFWRV